MPEPMSQASRLPVSVLELYDGREQAWVAAGSDCVRAQSPLPSLPADARGRGGPANI